MSGSGRILRGVRAQLRARGMTYSHLAAAIGVSEPTVKRDLSRGNFSLARLDRICEALEIGVEELPASFVSGALDALPGRLDAIGRDGADAGFDGLGFVTLFDKLQQASRLNDDGAFPYLRSHPLSSERMADMRARVPLDSDTVLINRRRYILHPRGVKFTSASVAGDSPTNAELVLDGTASIEENIAIIMKELF